MEHTVSLCKEPVMTHGAVTPQKQAALKERMAQLQINEKDLVETFILGHGKGGQKKNKTHSAVRISHTPSNVSVKSDASRSREVNRYVARRLLCDQIEHHQTGRVKKKDTLIDKKRKQKKRIRRRQQKKERGSFDDPGICSLK